MITKLAVENDLTPDWFLSDVEISENNLPQQIQTLRTIIDSLAEGVIIADRKGKFLLFNPVAEKILGIGSQDVSSAEWTQIYGCYYPDEVTPYPSDKLPLALAIQGQIITDEIIFIKNPRRPDGVYIDISASPLKDASGKIIGGTMIFRDISESIRVKDLQEQSEKRTSAQFKGVPIPTYVWERRQDDFILVDYNNAAHDITNGNVKKYLGKKFSKIFKDSPRILEDLTRCYNKQTVITREMPHRMRTTGEHKEIIFTYVYVPIDLVLMHMQDITELKKTEKELTKLSNAVEQTADSILITDRRGIIEYVNQGFEETTGYSRQEAIGQTPRILNSGLHDRLFYKNLWKIIRSGEAFRDTIINKKKSGEYYWSQQTITPMKDKNGKISHYVSVLKDITEFKKRQEHEFHLQLAQEVQKKLYNFQVSIPGFDMAGNTFPADETDGDYFDFIHLPDGCIGLVIGDVSGHGISSALIMAETRAYLRAFAKKESDPGILLTLLNQELVADLDEAHYVTMILARIDPKRKVMDYASAAHVPAYLLNKRGQIKYTMESQGIPLGFIKEVKYTKSDEIEIAADDIAIFLTDGITEANVIEDQQFGPQRAIEIVKKYRKEPSQNIINRLYEAVQSFTHDQARQDDITSIVCKMVG